MNQNKKQPQNKEKYILKILSLCSLLIFFGGWQLIVELGIVPNVLLATPTQVLSLFFKKLTMDSPDGAVLLVHTWISMKEVLTGYFLSLLVGIPVGLLMAWFVLAEGLIRPIFEIIRPIPPVAWIPLSIFWFGIGIEGKIFIIWASGVVPCVINSFVGVRMTNPTLIQMARTYGASDWQVFIQICVPSALPMVFGALQIALAYCWLTLVAAELIAADKGLGFLITMGRRLLMPDMIILGMLMVGLTGALFSFIIGIVEKRLLVGWKKRV